MFGLQEIVAMNQPGAKAPVTIHRPEAVKPRIVVVIEGGIVQEVLSTFPAEVLRIDYDTEGAEASELTLIPQDDGKTEEAFASLWPAEVVPERVAELFSGVEADWAKAQPGNEPITA